MALIELKTTTNRILTAFNNLVTGILTSLNSDGTLKRKLGAWQELAFDTIYQANTDGLVHAFASSSGIGKEALLIAMTDANNPPTTYRTGAHSIPTAGMNTSYNGLCMAVKKGDFWKVYSEVVGIVIPGKIFWIPFEE